jgi:hypothetical protein
MIKMKSKNKNGNQYMFIEMVYKNGALSFDVKHFGETIFSMPISDLDCVNEMLEIGAKFCLYAENNPKCDDFGFTMQEIEGQMHLSVKKSKGETLDIDMDCVLDETYTKILKKLIANKCCEEGCENVGDLHLYGLDVYCRDCMTDFDKHECKECGDWFDFNEFNHEEELCEDCFQEYKENADDDCDDPYEYYGLRKSEF